jgi:hypothetical protein
MSDIAAATVLSTGSQESDGETNSDVPPPLQDAESSYPLSFGNAFMICDNPTNAGKSVSPRSWVYINNINTLLYKTYSSGAIKTASTSIRTARSG